ncbi:universal stress protein [Bacillus sp. Marseille-P3661]|uniref:universal stress protein n=1 Tax=Bacillus sp. Marseille-P3661 TaxID=1936234 RepID=UPI000C853DE6|nr:universal stress protein [Bacillus sp. Marseille-P3661]
MYKKILLASDGSEHSLRAANQAIELAKCNPESVVVVAYVVDSSKAKSEVLQNWNNLGVTDTRKEKITKTEEKAKEAGITYEIKFLRGEPGPALVDFVNGNHFDLVVVGSRGLNSLQEMVLGSVSHKIAKRAQCPVLIVK